MSIFYFAYFAEVLTTGFLAGIVMVDEEPLSEPPLEGLTILFLLASANNDILLWKI